MSKHTSLLISLSILTFMALFTETNVPIVKGYHITPDQLESGERIFQEFCFKCHGGMKTDAPSLNETDEWEKRLAKGVKSLVENAWGNFRGSTGICPPQGESSGLSYEEVELAVAFIVKQAHQNEEKNRGILKGVPNPR